METTARRHVILTVRQDVTSFLVSVPVAVKRTGVYIVSIPVHRDVTLTTVVINCPALATCVNKVHLERCVTETAVKCVLEFSATD